MINFDLIRPNIFLGSCPGNKTDVTRLAEALGVTGVLCLQTDSDFTKWNIAWEEVQTTYTRHNIFLMRSPIIDFDRADLEEKVKDAAEVLDQMLAVGHRVYVHCTAGQERAPATVISHLVMTEDLSLQAAVDEVTSKRQCKPFVDVLEKVFDQPAELKS